jgi:hypothetical protein
LIICGLEERYSNYDEAFMVCKDLTRKKIFNYRIGDKDIPVFVFCAKLIYFTDFSTFSHTFYGKGYSCNKEKRDFDTRNKAIERIIN